jgi:nucleotide-binding universal stress UspA family protein
MVERLRPQEKMLLDHVFGESYVRNVALYTKSRAAATISDGILAELEHRHNVKLLLTGWPGPVNPQTSNENLVKTVLKKARTNVVVLLDRGLEDVRHILVPVGGGLHSRLAIRLAYEISLAEKAQITALRVLTGASRDGDEEVEDKTLLLDEIIEDVLGSVPASFALRVTQADSVPKGILMESARQPVDLIVMGASEEWPQNTLLFGSVDDWIADAAPCSVLLCRRYEPVAISWLRRQVKIIEREYERVNGHNPSTPKDKVMTGTAGSAPPTKHRPT